MFKYVHHNNFQNVSKYVNCMEIKVMGQCMCFLINSVYDPVKFCLI